MYKCLPIPWCIIIYSCRKCCSWAVGGGRSVKLAVIWMRRDAALHHSLACYSHSRVSSLREMRGKDTHLLTILITLSKEGGKSEGGSSVKSKAVQPHKPCRESQRGVNGMLWPLCERVGLHIHLTYSRRILLECLTLTWAFFQMKSILKIKQNVRCTVCLSEEVFVEISKIFSI